MTDNDVVTGAPAIQIQAELQPRFDEILTADALDFIAELTRRFGPRRLELLQARADRYAAGDPGQSFRRQPRAFADRYRRLQRRLADRSALE